MVNMQMYSAIIPDRVIEELNLIAKFAGIKSIHQYPLFRSKDNVVNSAKIFT